MRNITRAVFDATASTYDRDRSRLIPGCDSFYRWAVDLLPSGAESIVDLGAGSGLYSLLIRQRFPTAHLYLLDFSGAMLDLARNRLGSDPNVTYIQADYVTEPIPEQVSAVVSALSIHHLEDDDKRRVLQSVYQALRPGGVFINAEQVAGPTSELEARYRALWLHQVRALGATEQQVTDSLYRQQQDRCVDVGRQLAWMREAGFADADCWYKEGRLAVMSGTRR
jgi:tRNA (cmo5U34)-methyltransferase